MHHTNSFIQVKGPFKKPFYVFFKTNKKSRLLQHIGNLAAAVRSLDVVLKIEVQVRLVRWGCINDISESGYQC